MTYTPEFKNWAVKTVLPKDVVAVDESVVEEISRDTHVVLSAFARLVMEESLKACNHPVIEPRPCGHCRDATFLFLSAKFGLEGKP